jgi:phosphoribosylglycinamide formyltransferase-1
MINLAFLATNHGSGFRAVVGAIEAGRLKARACLAVSNRRGAPALAFARAHDIPWRVIPTLPDPDVADVRLREALTQAGADLVILSGYLRRLGPKVLAAYAGRILNIHPALLPDFGGEGMYGLRVHEAVIASGARVSGATVHLVDQDYDCGPVVARCEVPVLSDDTPQSLQARVTAIEGNLFIETLQMIADGRSHLVRVGSER